MVPETAPAWTPQLTCSGLALGWSDLEKASCCVSLHGGRKNVRQPAAGCQGAGKVLYAATCVRLCAARHLLWCSLLITRMHQSRIGRDEPQFRIHPHYQSWASLIATFPNDLSDLSTSQCRQRQVHEPSDKVSGSYCILLAGLQGFATKPMGRVRAAPGLKQRHG